MTDENNRIDELLDLEPEIQGCLKKRSAMVRFPTRLEAYFSRIDAPRRRKRYLILGMLAILLFDIFCIADRIMLPDIYLIAWKIRLGLVTPVMCACLILIHFPKMERFMDLLTGFLLVLTSATIIYFLIISHHPNVVHYHTGLILIVTFGCIVVRIKFPYACFFSFLILAGYVLFIGHASQMPKEAAQNSSLVLFTACIISLVGNYRLESEARRDFLMTLLQKINTNKLEETNRLLERLSISDELTGLANRRHFNASLTREWNAAARNQYALSLLFLDIDFFKAYNDNYGHQAGDHCLREIGRILRGTVRRSQDLPARYGGEEFVILLPHMAIPEAVEIAESIRQAIEELQIQHDHSAIAGHITVSLGVAGTIPHSNTTPSRLLKTADEALYQAKNAGRNRVVCADETEKAHSGRMATHAP